MQVASGTVVNRKIVIEGAHPPGSAVVKVLVRGADESFLLSEAQENELLAAIEEIERCECITLDDVLLSLPQHR